MKIGEIGKNYIVIGTKIPLERIEDGTMVVDMRALPLDKYPALLGRGDAALPYVLIFQRHQARAAIRMIEQLPIHSTGEQA